MPLDKNRSIYADSVSGGTICSAENGDVSASRNTYFRLGRLAYALKLAAAVWYKWYLRGSGERFWVRVKNMQSLEGKRFLFSKVASDRLEFGGLGIKCKQD